MVPKQHHVVELQSIRGIAAFMVLAAHALTYFATPAWFLTLTDLSNGEAAVVVFFVLSGYVLTYSLRRSDFSARDVSNFLVKRVFRIYPALWAASLLGLLYLAWMRNGPPVPGASEAVLGLFRPDRMKPLYIGASLAGAYNYILPPSWTIFVELVASAVIPAAAFLVYRRPRLFWWCLGGAALISLTVGTRTYSGLLLYMVDFVMGASICIWPPAADRLLRRLGRVRAPLFAAAAAALIAIPFAVANMTDPRPALMITAIGPWGQLAMAACATLMIALIVRGGLQNGLLRRPGFVWLGDISYSVYLLHFPILCILARAAAAIWPDPAGRLGPVPASLLLLAATVAVTLPLSWLAYRGIERPGIALGQRTVRHLKIERPRAADQPPQGGIA